MIAKIKPEITENTIIPLIFEIDISVEKNGMTPPKSLSINIKINSTPKTATVDIIHAKIILIQTPAIKSTMRFLENQASKNLSPLPQ